MAHHLPHDHAFAIPQHIDNGNKSYVGEHEAKGHGALTLPPKHKLIIITCMDARIEPLRQLGLELGDAHVIRNAGGRVSLEAARSVVISQQLLGTEEIFVFHHTDCGMATFTTAQLQQQLSTQASFSGNGALINSFAFLDFSDLKKSIIDDVQFLLDYPLIKSGTPISGFIFDVKSGAIIAIKEGKHA